MSIKKKYTARKKCGAKQYTVWFKSGVQSFRLAHEYSATEAEWMRTKLAQALINTISAERPLKL